MLHKNKAEANFYLANNNIPRRDRQSKNNSNQMTSKKQKSRLQTKKNLSSYKVT